MCLPLFSVVVEGLTLTFVALRRAACLIHLDFLFGRLFYTKPLVARRGFEPLVFRMKIWCPRPLDERAIIKDLFFSIFPEILIRRKPNRPRLCYRYKSCKTFNECDPAGARTQDPNIKSVVLYQLSYGVKLNRYILMKPRHPIYPTTKLNVPTCSIVRLNSLRYKRMYLFIVKVYELFLVHPPIYSKFTVPTSYHPWLLPCYPAQVVFASVWTRLC